MHRRSGSGDKTLGRVTERLKEVIECLTHCCGTAEELIMFGSYGRGDYSIDSSIDLLMIAKTDLPFVERIVRALECVPEGVPGVEILVYTPKEISKKLEENESFLASAMHEGVLIWSKRVKFDLETQLKNATSAAQSEYRGLLHETD